MVETTTLGGLGALIYTPEGYVHKPGAPVWLFAPGNGEVKGIENLYTHNLLSFIRNGAKPNFVFAAVSPGQSWFAAESLFRAVSELKSRFPGCKLIGNGLSIGGWAWVNYVNAGKKYADTVDGLVIMSANLAGTTNLSSFAGKPVLSYASRRESPEVLYSHPKMMDAFEAAGARVTRFVIPFDGHGGWSMIYNYPGEVYAKMHQLLDVGKPVEPEVPETPTRELLFTLKVYSDGFTEKI